MNIFLEVTYTVNLPSGDLSFMVGQTLSEDYSELRNSVFITANNPNGVVCDNNTELNNMLLSDIKNKYCCGVGGDDKHIEYHYLVFNTSVYDGYKLAVKYNQLAYLYIDDSLKVSLQVGI